MQTRARRPLRTRKSHHANWTGKSSMSCGNTAIQSENAWLSCWVSEETSWSLRGGQPIPASEPSKSHNTRENGSANDGSTQAAAPLTSNHADGSRHDRADKPIASNKIPTSARQSPRRLARIRSPQVHGLGREIKTQHLVSKTVNDSSALTRAATPLMTPRECHGEPETRRTAEVKHPFLLGSRRHYR